MRDIPSFGVVVEFLSCKLDVVPTKTKNIEENRTNMSKCLKQTTQLALYNECTIGSFSFYHTRNAARNRQQERETKMRIIKEMQLETNRKIIICKFTC